MSPENIVVQPIQEAQPSQEPMVAKTTCVCGVPFTPGFGSVPGLKVLYNRVRKGVVDPLHPLTKLELLAEEFCGSRHCPAFALAEAETKSLAKPGDKPERVAFYTPNTLRLMADWAERNARKLAEADARARRDAWKQRQVEKAHTPIVTRLSYVNKTLEEAGEKHGYHPKRKSKRQPMSERRLKTPKAKSSALPDAKGKKKNKKGKDGDNKKGGKGKGKK